MEPSVGSNGNVDVEQLEDRLKGMMRNWKRFRRFVVDSAVEDLQELVKRIPPASLGRKWQLERKRKEDPLETALILTARCGWQEGACIIARAVPPESLAIKNRYGYSALYYAAERTLDTLAYVLIERLPHSALLLQAGEAGHLPPLCCAAKFRSSPAIMRSICERIGPENLARAGLPEALREACASFAILEALLEFVPPEELATIVIDGQNTIHWTAACPNPRCLQLVAPLLPEECRWAQDKDGQTPLFKTTSAATTSALLDLLPESALALTDAGGFTALHRCAEAAVCPRRYVTQVLLERLPREVVVMRNKDGCTAEDLVHANAEQWEHCGQPAFPTMTKGAV